MSSKTTVHRPPPIRASDFDAVMAAWLIGMAQIAPLVTVDTLLGPETIALPDPGSDSVGQTSLNNEIIYFKDTPDANTVTITGSKGGNVVLLAENDFARFKSDGTQWRRVG